jgi:tetratricopeptide (TPR) repeat protein
MRRARRIFAAGAAAIAALAASPPCSDAQARTPATELWQSSLAPTERDAELWSAQGKTLYDAGDFKQAAASFERALQLGTARPDEAALGVARAYARMGNRKQALRWLESAAERGKRKQGDGYYDAKSCVLPSLRFSSR